MRPTQEGKLTGVKSRRWSVLLQGGPITALLCLVAYFSFATPHFATLSNLVNTAQQNA
jgi:predicted ABC-type sugar transport system permease subunit